MAAAVVASAVLSGCERRRLPEPAARVLTGAAVIDVRRGTVHPDQRVVIAGGRIRAVGPAVGADGPVDTIDLTGRYLVPGFIDMHAHVTVLPFLEDGRVADSYDPADSRSALLALLAHGVTTIRNPGAPTEGGVALRDSVAAGHILGPAILTAGNPINRTAASFGPFVAVRDVASTRAEVRRQAASGVDFIKVYSALPPDLVTAAIDEAHRLGVRVIGHLQRTSWTLAAEAGIDAITHGAPWSMDYLPERARANYAGTLRDRMTWLEQVDLDDLAITGMLRSLVDHGVTVDPTLIAYDTKFRGNDPRYTQRPDLHIAPMGVRASWDRFTFTQDWTEADYARGRRVWPRVLALTKRMFDAGVLLTAGTDFPNPWVLPGLSLHEEMQLLHDAGIPPADVLAMATYHGAVALGLEHAIGSLEPGFEADIVVLRGNPLEDLRHTRDIEMVIVDGRIYRPSDLTGR